MENKIIIINKTKQELLALPQPDQVDFVGAMQEISKDYVEEVKSALKNSGKPEIKGKYYDAVISAPHGPQCKPQPNWKKIIEFGTKHGYNIPMTVDYDALEQEQWVKDLAGNEDLFIMVKGKPYAGKISLTKKVK